MGRAAGVKPAQLLPDFDSADAGTSDRQTLAALCTAGIDDGTTAAALHANQETVGAGTANF